MCSAAREQGKSILGRLIVDPLADDRGGRLDNFLRRADARMKAD